MTITVCVLTCIYYIAGYTIMIYSASESKDATKGRFSAAILDAVKISCSAASVWPAMLQARLSHRLMRERSIPTSIVSTEYTVLYS